MIYVTGDTHGYTDFYKLRMFANAHPWLTRDDYVIVAGDFGGVFDPFTLDEDLVLYERLPFTVLFVDGNHENFDLLERLFPVIEWKGGKAQKVRENIYHLMRGQVYEIQGKTIFTFGGGTSVDRARRVEGLSWWSQELPTYEQQEEGIKNLARYGNKVDYVITHSIDERALYYPVLRNVLSTAKAKVYFDNQILNWFEDNVDYGHWYFGHYHVDGKVTEKKTALYSDILPLTKQPPQVCVYSLKMVDKDASLIAAKEWLKTAEGATMKVSEDRLIILTDDGVDVSALFSALVEKAKACSVTAL